MKLRFPEGLDAASFLRRHWQREPLLLRGALPGFASPLTPEELAGLACEEEVEARAVVGDPLEACEVYPGPFPESFFSALPERNWTLLVHGVDLWVPEVRALFAAFDFLPPWRFDDVMVSYAAPGGGVGPHFDHYDVFLIQGLGRRRWRLGQRCSPDTPLRPDAPLRLLAHFEPAAELVVEPGDVLYLPPGVAHEGVALDPCITLSVGFRAPTAGELLDDLATEVLSRGGGPRYRDPLLEPAMADERIHPAFVDQVRALLREVLDDPDLLAEWFAAYMTRPKYPHLEGLPPRRARVRTAAGERLFVDGDPR
ncbi:MAG: hypothetical protein KatS3mg124_1254 [Porticoccaceae bacterium]|nr:MAG: hypothetical protein KatS3mg124_1254 [Porticoccaceae bacterium]